MREYIFPVTISILAIIAGFAGFADIAINGPLATPGLTFGVLAAAGIALMLAIAVMATVAIDIRDDREFARATAGRP